MGVISEVLDVVSLFDVASTGVIERLESFVWRGIGGNSFGEEDSMCTMGDWDAAGSFLLFLLLETDLILVVAEVDTPLIAIVLFVLVVEPKEASNSS